MGETAFFGWYMLPIGFVCICRYVRRFCLVKEYSSPFYSELMAAFGGSSWRSIIYHCFLVLCLVCFFCILSNPHRVGESGKESKSGIDIVLLLDISTSMLAEDFAPNRLEVAKKVVDDFIGTLSTDRLGMVVFAGKPFTSVPLTFDYDFTQQILSELDTSTINQRVRSLQGTAIGDALLSGLGVLEKGLESKKTPNNKNPDMQDVDDAREQILVLVTDGESSPGTLDPMVVSQLAKESGIKIYTIGIGSKKGGFITQQTPFGTQRQQIKGVDEKTLKDIASRTDGTYRRVENERVFKEVFETISRLSKSQIQMDVQRSYTSIWKPFGRVLVFSLCVCIVLHLYFPVHYVGPSSSRD